MSNEQRKALRHRWMIVTRSSAFVRPSSFDLRHSFVLRHSDFVILAFVIPSCFVIGISPFLEGWQK